MDQNGSLKTLLIVVTIYHHHDSHTSCLLTGLMSPVCQKRGTKRRLKSRGNGSMGVASERAVSIPQITYDHIDDSVEKKDDSFFLEEPRGPVEGNVLKRALLLLYCNIHYPD